MIIHHDVAVLCMEDTLHETKLRGPHGGHPMHVPVEYETMTRTSTKKLAEFTIPGRPCLGVGQICHHHCHFLPSIPAASCALWMVRWENACSIIIETPSTQKTRKMDFGHPPGAR